MSYIVRSGNLAAAPELHTAENGTTYTHADVIVNDRERQEDGSWHDTGTIRYSLTVFRSQAERLVQAATNGNLRVLFAGTYRVREYNRKDGSTGISHDVRVDEIGASFTGQSVTIQPTLNQTEQTN